jgi:aldehyde dehydrogenase (NAD+)
MAVTTQQQAETWNGQDLSASCYIDGAWIEGQSGESTTVVDPATERPLASVSFASTAQVEQAVDAARRAFDRGPWKDVSPADRSRLLHRLCDLFEERTDDFVNVIIAEAGSPIPLARVGQVQSALECLRWFADAAKTGPPGGYERGLALHHDPITTASLMRHEPAGVVASITAYNYPLLLLARKIGGVLASGCTTIVLPSERAPLATWEFFRMLDEVGYPPGVVNLVIGSRDVGVALTTSPGVDMVTFTGSVTVGREVMKQGATTTKRVVLELGGKSPTVVLPGADISQVVAPSITRFTVAAGQGCGCTTRTLVSKGDYDEYLDKAKDYIGGLRVGDPRAEGTDVGPLIRAEHRASVEGYVERALEAGGEILVGGGRPDEAAGYYMNPTYVGGLTNDAEIAQSELFGPVGVLLQYETVEEAIQIANASRYGLYAAVWGPTSDAMAVAQQLSAGTVAINGGGRLRPDVPWGGYRDSGNGREAGEDGFREFFEVKHIQWPI